MGTLIARVFPRRTAATPTDELAYIGEPGLFLPEVDEVHVSCTFSFDLPNAERLADAWSKRGYAVRIGGPAMGDPGDAFVPGRYLKYGHVITSRGCPNRCWFCEVWKREGDIRELPITDGWLLHDNNILACSENHIRAVFSMLGRQKHPVEFPGGLEAARLKPWHVELLAQLRPKQMFFAYDTPDDYEPLVMAGKMLREIWTDTSKTLRCYVLCGYPGDTIEAAEKRMLQTREAGFWPFAMLYVDRSGRAPRHSGWPQFQRCWARPAIMSAHEQNSDAPGQECKKIPGL